MPLFEYACRTCSQRFEQIRKFAERLDAPPCPACGAEHTVLCLSAPARVAAANASTRANAAESCDAPGGCCGGMCMN
jgi:putative FmdB family regulatory protein